MRWCFVTKALNFSNPHSFSAFRRKKWDFDIINAERLNLFNFNNQFIIKLVFQAEENKWFTIDQLLVDKESKKFKEPF